MTGRTLRLPALLSAAALLACLAILLASPKARAEPASPEPVDAGTIVLSTGDTPSYEGADIIAVPAEGGSEPVKLTDDPAPNLVPDYSPSVSPDGSEVLWERDGGIWRMGIDGSDKRCIIGCGAVADAHAPAWSPDGSGVAFHRGTYGGDIWTAGSDGTGQRRITGGGDFDKSPTWSPDGGRLAFQRMAAQEGGGYRVEEIYVVDADGGEAAPISDGVSIDGSHRPDWSPDGSEIAFSGYGFAAWDDYQGQIFVAGAEGAGPPRRIAGGVVEDQSQYYDHPSFSPDGSKIAFEADGGLGIMNRDGTDKKTVLISSDTAVRGTQPDWGPAPVPDTAEPAVTRPRPVPGARTRDRTPTVGATVRDESTDLAKADIRLYIDGSREAFSYDPATDRLSRTAGRLSLGQHRVKVVAEDTAGNVATEVWPFRVVGGR